MEHIFLHMIISKDDLFNFSYIFFVFLANMAISYSHQDMIRDVHVITAPSCREVLFQASFLVIRDSFRVYIR